MIWRKVGLLVPLSYLLVVQCSLAHVRCRVQYVTHVILLIFRIPAASYISSTFHRWNPPLPQEAVFLKVDR